MGDLSYLPVFIVDSYGTVVNMSEYYWDNSFVVPYFYEEDTMTYTAYIADNYEAETLDDLTNIRAVSNPIMVTKPEWNIQLSVEEVEYTSDTNFKFLWEANDTVGGYYEAYLVDLYDGNIISSYFLHDQVGQETAYVKYRADEDTKISIVVAKRAELAFNLSDLEEIQGISNTVSLKHTPYEAELTTDKNVLYTYDDIIDFNIKTNQSTLGTGYGLFLVNETTDETTHIDIFEVPESFEEPWFYPDGDQEYRLYIAEFEPGHTEKEDLKNIVEITDPIKIKQAPWHGSASVVQGEQKNKIVLQLNQPKTNWYYAYLVDKETDKIIWREDYLKHQSGSEIEIEDTKNKISGVHDVPSMFNGDYKVVISKDDNGRFENYSDLTDIQIEIDVKNNLPAPKWYINLSYNPIADENNAYNFKVSTNSTHYGEDYSAYVINDSTGEIINKYFGDELNYDFDQYFESQSANTYTAYIADRNDNATNISELKNIVANSKSIYPKFVPAPSDYKPTGGRFGGGFNPSNTDCQQQCYGDPVNNYTGEYFENSEDLIVDSISPLFLTRSYSTFKKDKIGSFGLGSTHNYNMSLTGEFDSLNDSDNIRVIQENGSTIDFIRATDGTFVASQGTQATLEKINNNYVLTRKTGESFTFDNTGKLIRISDLFNNTTVLTYVNNKISKITAADGKYIQINYNSSNLIDSIADGSRTISYIYDSQKRLVEVKSYETVNPKKYKYDTQNRVIEIAQPNGGVYKNTFNSEDQVTKQINPLNGETIFDYTEYTDTYQTTTTLPDGSVKVDEYDKYGRLVSEIFDESGKHQVFSYNYTSNGQISKTEKPDGSITSYIYDENGNISTIIDDLGRVTRFTYNDKNQVVERISPYGDVFVNNYNSEGRLQSTTDENGNTTKYSTNEQGRLTEIIHPDQADKESPKTEKIFYDTNGFISQNISPEGKAQKTIHNSIGLPTKFIDPLNNETTVDYDSHFNMIKQTYPNGTFEEYEYDNAGRLIETIDVLGNESTYTYDVMDNVISSTTPFGITNYEYDANQRLTKTAEPTGKITQHTYNDLGQLVEIKNGQENISQFEYDYSGNISATTDFNGNTTYYSYDSVGNLIDVTDADHNTTSYFYDKLNRLTKIEKANWNTEQYKYDKVGNLTTLNKNNVDSTVYSYDKNNHLIKTTYNNESADQRSYDADGSLTSFINRDGKTTSYKYNLNSQVIETTRPDNSKESIKYNAMGEITQISYDNWTSIDTEYEYNNLGQLTKAIKDNNETNYAYDSIGQLTSRGPPAQQVDYSYDNYGRLNEIQYPFGSTVQYSYNSLNNIDKVLLNDTEEIVEYDYDANGNILDETYGNVINRSSEYDALNRLTNFNIQNNSSSLYSRSLTYDQTYLLETVNTSINEVVFEDKEFSYSSLEKLSEVFDYETYEQEDYEIDNYSNLLESPVSNNIVSKNGQLISSEINDVNYSYSFDEKGNRLSKANDVNDSASAYSWSNDNKLENLTTTRVNGSSTSIDYTYDASGLLKSRAKDNVSTDDYVWDTLSSIPLLLEDGNNEYIYGNDASPIAQIDKDSGDISYLHGDERGSVVLATDNAGNSLLTREYDAYGNHTDEVITNPSNAPPNDFYTNFAYAGEYQDKDTGLYNLRARWYEPLTGSFINQDPALISTGEGYSYASGNPLSFTDPLGLYSMGPTPSDNTAGNMTAGFVDGLIGYPVVHKVSNYIKPGSVSNCGPGYKYSGYAGMATGFLIPGGAAVKGGTMALKGASKSGKLWSYVKSRISSDKASVEFSSFGKIERGSVKTEDPEDIIDIYRRTGQKESMQIDQTNRFEIGGKAAYEDNKLFFTDKDKLNSINYEKDVSDYGAKIKRKYTSPINTTGIESSAVSIRNEHLNKIYNIRKL